MGIKSGLKKKKKELVYPNSLAWTQTHLKESQTQMLLSPYFYCIL